MSLRVIFDRKLYREVVWSQELKRVLDTNFTFFKSKIHSNWHVFKLTSHNYSLFIIRYSVFIIIYSMFLNSAFSKPYSLFGIQYSVSTTHHSRLTTHLSQLTTHDSRLTTHFSPLTTIPLYHYTIILTTTHHSPFHHSRLICHFEWFSIENCIEKWFEVMSLVEFSIQISLFFKSQIHSNWH